MKIIRWKITVNGIVQGVGFRPFVYKLANSYDLKGRVSNISDGVIIDIEGIQESMTSFADSLQKNAPPLSIISNIGIEPEEPIGYKEFEIMKSENTEEKRAYFSPDVSICDDCTKELFDKSNARYQYPFINCTNCGPRFSIIKGVPYDRNNTTMEKFNMCKMCENEYTDPGDRRYHAQPVSCYNCGPRLKLTDDKGIQLACTNELQKARELLLQGNIIAIKGIGGYHLVCDAKNKDAVNLLRKRKHRDDKPFALMAKDCGTVIKYCKLNEDERFLIESVQKPIVLLEKLMGCKLPEEIASGNPNLGIMLPYTPVHLLLFNYGDELNEKLEILVMTSANISSEPICYKDEEAFKVLGDIADYFLLNDREIHIRTDDSVTRSFLGKEYIIRRSRGYAPAPITCNSLIFSTSPSVSKTDGDKSFPSVLACGGELKNTFCISRDNEFFISHHIGDLENFETLNSFEEGIDHLSKLFNIKYDVIAYDMHPEYLSTKYALSKEFKILIPVQHHHAHIAACACENNLEGNTIGVAFDGTGYGEDGHIWGGEFFTGNYAGYKREGHFEYVPMPGGQKTIKEPWRMALSYLFKYFGEDNKEGFETYFPDVSLSSIELALQMVDKKVNSPFTSSAGRLFDAVAALLGIRTIINYEGQAAIELEQAIQKGRNGVYCFNIIDENGLFKICVKDMFEGIIGDMKNGVSIGIISSKFHETISLIIVECCIRIREKTKLDRVVLSGGVFQNITLLKSSIIKLEKMGFKVYIHNKVPSNDGGISLGQAAIAIAKTINKAFC